VSVDSLAKFGKSYIPLTQKETFPTWQIEATPSFNVAGLAFTASTTPSSCAVKLYLLITRCGFSTEAQIARQKLDVTI
jgi:hypothetical protein